MPTSRVILVVVIAVVTVAAIVVAGTAGVIIAVGEVITLRRQARDEVSEFDRDVHDCRLHGINGAG
jgi:hypothetical protein